MGASGSKADGLPGEVDIAPSDLLVSQYEGFFARVVTERDFDKVASRFFPPHTLAAVKIWSNEDTEGTFEQHLESLEKAIGRPYDRTIFITPLVLRRLASNVTIRNNQSEDTLFLFDNMSSRLYIAMICLAAVVQGWSVVFVNKEAEFVDRLDPFFEVRLADTATNARGALVTRWAKECPRELIMNRSDFFRAVMCRASEKY